MGEEPKQSSLLDKLKEHLKMEDENGRLIHDPGQGFVHILIRDDEKRAIKKLQNLVGELDKVSDALEKNDKRILANMLPVIDAFKEYVREEKEKFGFKYRDTDKADIMIANADAATAIITEIVGPQKTLTEQATDLIHHYFPSKEQSDEEVVRRETPPSIDVDGNLDAEIAKITAHVELTDEEEKGPAWFNQLSEKVTAVGEYVKEQYQDLPEKEHVFSYVRDALLTAVNQVAGDKEGTRKPEDPAGVVDEEIENTQISKDKEQGQEGPN